MIGCATPHPASVSSVSYTFGGEDAGTLAQVYFWRAKPDKIAEYTRYVREVAEPIDHEAQRVGAFLSVTTYQATDTTLPWTHMRVFQLRDSAQWRGLADALKAAGIRIEPDSVRRHERAAHASTLRDPAGSMLTRVMR